MVAVSKEEMAAAVILPHFDAVRDVFLSFCPEPGFNLDLAAKIKFRVTRTMHDSPRHFAGTLDDGLQMLFAPQIIDLDESTFVAILAHEFGHAVDFLYPGRWIVPHHGPGKAEWISDEEDHHARKWKKLWQSRSRDVVEWAADGIAWAVTGRKILYGGDCVLQRFGKGFERPAGLR